MTYFYQMPYREGCPCGSCQREAEARKAREQELVDILSTPGWQRVIQAFKKAFPPDYGNRCNDPACTDRECVLIRHKAKENQ